MNLVSNAIKYCDPEKPQRFVHVETQPTIGPGFCLHRRARNGLGIQNPVRRRCFDGLSGRTLIGTLSSRFEDRASGSPSPAECVEAVGGSIRVESTVGLGTSFFVTIPNEPPQTIPSEKPPSGTEPGAVP